MPDTILPKISVVTPSFNQAKYLEETIDSILSQKYPNLEYIIMDGGSTDGSVEIIKKYSDHLVHWESNPDGGQYEAIQKGFARSHGEIMAYLNSDDLYFPWTLKAVAEIFTKFPQVDWLMTANIVKTPHDHHLNFGNQIYNRSQRWFLSKRGSNGFVPQESTFWRRTLWEKAGSNIDANLQYAGDMELWSRFYKYANPTLVDVPLGIYRYHQGQKTASLEKYLAEAKTIFSKFSKPVWIPRFAIQVLNFIYRKIDGRKNWLGARCDKIFYLPAQNDWSFKKYLEWRD